MDYMDHMGNHSQHSHMEHHDMDGGMEIMDEDMSIVDDLDMKMKMDMNQMDHMDHMDHSERIFLGRNLFVDLKYFFFRNDLFINPRIWSRIPLYAVLILTYREKLFMALMKYGLL